MAISSNRLNTRELTKLEKADYSTTVDPTSVQSLSELQSIGTDMLDTVNGYKDSILSNPLIKDHNLGLEGLGVFENVMCCKYPSLNVRLPSYNKTLNMNLDMSFNVEICGKSKSINPIDTAMQVVSFVNTYPGILSGDREYLLRTLLSTDLVRKMNILGLGSVLPDCVLDKVGGFVSGNYGPGPFGTTLSGKSQINQLLAKDKCARMIASKIGLWDMLSVGTNSHLLNVLLDGDLARGSTYFNNVLAVPEQRPSALQGFSQSFSYDYSTAQSYKKIEILYVAKQEKLIEDKDTVYLNTDGKVILDAIKEDETEKKDLDKIHTVLDMMDPTWHKDTEDGKDNYYLTKDNEVLNTLANDKLLNTTTDDIDLDGIYTTTLNIEHHIAIINAFN